MYTKFASILSLAVAASAANWGATSSSVTVNDTSSVITISRTRAGPYPVPTCVVYYGWNDTLSSATPISTTVTGSGYYSIGSPTPVTDVTSTFASPTVFPRENWGSSSANSPNVTATGPFTSSVMATVTVTLLPNGTAGRPALPFPTSWAACNQTYTLGGRPTSSVTAAGTATSSPGAPQGTSSADGAQAQGQGQGQGQNTGTGYTVSSSMGAVTFIAAIGVALAL